MPIKNSQRVTQEFFRKSKYYRYLYVYKLNLMNENALHLQADFASAYQAFM